MINKKLAKVAMKEMVIWTIASLHLDWQLFKRKCSVFRDILNEYFLTLQGGTVISTTFPEDSFTIWIKSFKMLMLGDLVFHFQEFKRLSLDFSFSINWIIFLGILNWLLSYVCFSSVLCIIIDLEIMCYVKLAPGLYYLSLQHSWYIIVH